ncbi:MAG: cysteine desulfurase [Clostridiales bacterium]|nr:cysteine desulfurase [Clostridiales bacterium]
MIAYLDNSATTKISDGARDVMVKVMNEDYGNPSSLHIMGVNAERHMKEAARVIADCMKVNPKEIVFTSGGTEANNMAIIGTALTYHRLGKHLITTRIEHPSVYQPMLFLEEQGFKIDFMPVDGEGRIIKEKLYEAIRDDTLLLSIMYVNNEIGSVQDIEEIAAKIKSIKNDIILHVDAVQAFGKYKIYPKKMGIDLLSVSGHKIHGPKGAGALYVSDKIRLKPIIFGGGQQGGLRSGTENVPAIAGFGYAAVEAYTDFEQKTGKMYELKQYFINEAMKLDGIRVNGLPASSGEYTEEQIKKTAPHIISISFSGVRSEVLLHALEERGIYVSTGSACSSRHPRPSVTLESIGVPSDLIESTIRFSMSDRTTREELDYTLEQVRELLPKLRRFVRR